MSIFKLRSFGLHHTDIKPTLWFLLHDARSSCSEPDTQLLLLLLLLLLHLLLLLNQTRATCRMASVETAAEHERILREIESTDTNCIGPTLR